MICHDYGHNNDNDIHDNPDKHNISVFNLILPCILITGIALMSFYMPSDSGEKVIILMTMMMTAFIMTTMMVTAIMMTAMMIRRIINDSLGFNVQSQLTGGAWRVWIPS